MQLGWATHFAEIVTPAWQDYLAAEGELTAACRVQDPAIQEKAGFKALRMGGAATFYLSHFADIVAYDRPDHLPDDVKDLSGVRMWLAAHCEMLRSGKSVEDVQLLADVCATRLSTANSHDVLISGKSPAKTPFSQWAAGSESLPLVKGNLVELIR